MVGTIEKDKIESLLKKRGFALTKKENVWTKGVPPNQWGVDLNKFLPEVYVLFGTERVSKDHDIIELTEIEQDIKNILKIRDDKTAGGAPRTEPPGGATNSTPLPAAQDKKIKCICKDCSKEFESTREQAEKIFEEIGYVCCEECLKKVQKKPEQQEKKKSDVTLAAKQERATPPAKKISDAELDRQIETAKAKRFLEGRGTSYKVQGKERPDAHKIQNVANEKGINIEILEATQGDSFSRVVVRAYLGEQFCDAVVHHDFKTEYMLKTMEIISKNPDILDHWEMTEPVIREKAKIKVNENGKEVLKDAKHYIVHALLSFKKFSLRDARTKAASIAESMLLNRDWRDDEEVKSELSERALVEESMKNAKVAKASA